MTTYQEYKYYLQFFIRFQKWTYGDLRRSSIKARANFLVAMSVFNYIEILGSFYRYKNKYTFNGKPHKYDARFNFAIDNLFDNTYKKELSKIKKLVITQNMYDMFRSGMSHEYLIKTYKAKNNKSLFFTVFNEKNRFAYNLIVNSQLCGITLVNNSENYKVNIYNPKLIEDYYLACEKYKRYLKNNKKGYRINFIKRARDINLDRLV